MSDRQQITPSQIRSAIRSFRGELNNRLGEKGYGTFSSRHETLGVVTDEYSEFLKAVQEKLPLLDVRHELLDIAVACVFGVACIDAEAFDW